MLDVILNPLLKLGPLATIAILGLSITLLSNIAYKLLTDQTRMKHLKKKQKEHQAEMKKHKDNPDKLMKVQQKAMQVNMEYMKNSFRPMIFTMLPIIIVFGWMNAHLNYMPIQPGEDFTTSVMFEQGIEGQVTLSSITPEGMITVKDERTKDIVDGAATWTLNGPAGEYIIEYEYEEDTYSREILIDEYLYKPAEVDADNAEIRTLTINYEKTHPIQLGFINLPWLWSYILISLVFNIIVRKVMKIH